MQATATELRAAFEAQNKTRDDFEALNRAFDLFIEQMNQPVYTNGMENDTFTVCTLSVVNGEPFALGYFGKYRKGKKTDWRMLLYETPQWRKALKEAFNQ